MPQPMSMVPQFLPSAAQVVGMHTPHTFAVPPPPHVSTGTITTLPSAAASSSVAASPVAAPASEVVEQVPQFCIMPQPMSKVPQFFPCAAQVVGMHTPQTLAVPPPPQVVGEVQLPHSILFPHPSETTPQFLPSSAQVCGTQPLQTLLMHVAPAGHDPQATACPVHGSVTLPHVAF
jgi:hypothetical protein